MKLQKLIGSIAGVFISLNAGCLNTQEISLTEKDLEERRAQFNLESMLRTERAIKDIEQAREIRLIEWQKAIKTVYDIPHLKLESKDTSIKLNVDDFRTSSIDRNDNTLKEYVGSAEYANVIEDKELLGWPIDSDLVGVADKEGDGGDGWFVKWISSDGKILYRRYYYKYENNKKEIGESADILYNPTLSKKFILRYFPAKTQIGAWQNHIDMSKNGKVLHLGFPREDNPRKHVGDNYFIDLNDNMKILYKNRGTSLGSSSRYRFSEDGRLYFTGSEIVNIFEGKETPLRMAGWNPNERPDSYVISPNFRYIAGSFGVFPTASFIEGQWATSVITPNGNYIFLARRSLIPKEIKDDGTLIDYRGHIFKLEGETYKCIKAPELGSLGTPFDKEIPLEGLIIRPITPLRKN